MKCIFFGVVIWCLFGVCAVAQNAPFEQFRKAVKEEPAGFSGNKENLSKVFNKERIALGDRFEAELWKYLGDDPDKHYWIGSFVNSKSYLHGSKPLPDLAFKIYTSALELLERKNDKRSLGRKVTINRHLAVLSKLAGKQDDAVRFRDKAEKIVSNRDDLQPYIAGWMHYDICVYQNLAGSIEKCVENPPQKERIVSGGWLNGRAINFVDAEYPSELGKGGPKGKVDVRILIDVNGNVISADIIRGPMEFHKAAVDAAMQAKFSPTLLSGVPTKVTGWLSYDFKP